MRTRRSRLWLAPFLLVCVGAMPAAAQLVDDNPVYVDDSPQAWELFRRAQDQVRDNPSEAARLYQQLLDDYGYRLIPRREGDESQMLSVRTRVHAALREQNVVRERYRLLQNAEAERLRDAGELDRLVRTRFFTAPALEAILQLSQRDLEAARFHRALDRLREAEFHPDLTGRSRAYFWFMLALAAHHANDPLTAGHARQELSLMSEAAARALRPELERLLENVAEPQIEPVYGPRTVSPSPDFIEMHGQPIWVLTLEESLLRRRHAVDAANTPARSGTYQAERLGGDLLTAVPTLVAQTVYINEGHRVRAVDRFSQRVLWAQTIGRSDAQPSPGDQSAPSDLNTIVIEGDALVTLSGHGHQSHRTGRGEVVCLDRTNGSIRWRVDLDMLNGRAEYERLYPHGSPIIAEGAVYVLARKPTRELLSSCYLISLDLVTGDLRWARYIAASSGLARDDMRPITSPLYHQGEIFVSTPLGAIAGVSASTGEMRWLKRYSVPIVNAPLKRVPWHYPEPVMTPRGLVAIAPDQRTVVLLDRETGDELERYEGVHFGSPRYLLADDFSVYAVGDSIYAYTQEDLTAPRWVADRSALGEMRGRVQLARGGLIVPTSEAITHLDDVTGTPMGRVDVAGGGNPLAVGPQLFVAASDELRSYMAIGVAEEMLRERIVQRPNDPEPALSLLRLALRAGDLALGLDAADGIMTVIERLPREASGRSAARTELFDQLLAFDRSGASRTRDQGDALHARLAMVAESTTERVRQMLARGAWLARSAQDDVERQRDAAATYDAILADASLARATFMDDDSILRPAHHAAADRLGRLVQEYGAAALGEVLTTGKARLTAAMTGGEASELAELVARYPLLPESTAATILAAEKFAQAGQPRRAMGLLMERARVPGIASPQRVYGAIAEIAEAQGWHRLAAAWLDRARHQAGLTEVITTAGSRRIDAWREAIGRADRAELPELGDFPDDITPKRLLGRVLHPIADGGSVPTDEAYLLEGSLLHAVSGPELAMRWTSELSSSRASLVGRVGGEVLMLIDGDSRRLIEPALVAVSAGNGAADWTLSNLHARLFGTREEEQRGPLREEVMPNGRVFDPRDVIPLVQGDRVLLVGRLAGMISIDPARKGEEHWRVDHGLTQVHFARVHDLAIVLAGVIETPGAGRRGARQPVIRFFDPRTGALLDERRPQDDEFVRWLTIADDGWAAFGTNSAVELVSLASAGRAWANLSDTAPDMQNAWPTSTGFLAQDGTASLHAISGRSGIIESPIVVPGGDWFPSELLAVAPGAGATLAHYRDRVLYFDDLGRLSGRDAIVEDRNYTHLIPAQDRVIVVSHIRRPRSVIPEPGRRPSLFVDRLYVLSTNGMVTGGRDVESESAPLSAAGAVDGWILLSADQYTVAVPAPLR